MVFCFKVLLTLLLYFPQKKDIEKMLYGVVLMFMTLCKAVKCKLLLDNMYNIKRLQKNFAINRTIKILKREFEDNRDRT